MATSPNYSWPEPDNTDLVKNGALAIRTMGNAIDTTMATMTPKSTYTAKGSIAAATGASTPANLSVGNNGETLVADSSTSTGLRYQGHIEAGKNFLNNGAMDVWQRGTSFTNGGIYGPDRWYLDVSAATTTWARETTIIPTGCQYSLKATQATAASTVVIAQTIEKLNAVALAGQTISLSAYVAASASTTLTFELAYSTSVDNARSGSWTAITATSGGSTTVSTTTFSRLAGVYAIPSTAKTLKVTLFTSSLGVGVSMYMSGLQLELGSIPTTLSRLGGSIQGELFACERYFEKSYDQATAPGTVTASGSFTSSGSAASATTTYLSGLLQYKTRKRISPTVTFYDNAGTAGKCSRIILGGADSNNEAIAIGNAGESQGLVYSTSGASKTNIMFQWTASAEL